MKILVVPGDGIGPEITQASLAALDAVQKKYKLKLDLSEADCGLRSLKKRGVTLRDEDIERARQADGVILGPMSVREYPPPEQGGINVPAQFCTRLGLYTNIRGDALGAHRGEAPGPADCCRGAGAD